MLDTSRQSVRLGLAAGYLLAAVALDLASSHFITQTGLAVSYPPAGLYMAAVLLLGWRALPLAFLSPLFSLLVTPAGADVALPAALAISAVSMISPALALSLARRRGPDSLVLNGLEKTGHFIIVILSVTAVEALAAALVYTAAGLSSRADYMQTALLWWLSNTAPMLTITPLILIVRRPTHTLPMRWRGWPGMLAVSVTFFTWLTTWFALATGQGGSGRLYISLLPVFLGALGGGLIGACWGNIWLGAAVLVLAPTYVTDPTALAETQFFLLAASLATLVTGAVVTDRRRVEAGLRQSELRFRLLAETATDVISQHKASGEFLYVSPASQALLGYAPEELIDRSVIELIHPDDLRAVGSFLRQLLNKTDAISTIAYRLRHKDRRYLHVETTSRCVTDSNGRVSLIACSTRDISQRKQAEEALQRLNADLEQRVANRTEDLERKARELETFAYSVAHDLKAPLRGISGYTTLLAEDYAAIMNDEGRFYLQNIRSAAVRMGQLIEDLLTYARLERSRMELAEVDLRALAEQLLLERAAEIDARQVQIQLSLECQTVYAEFDGLTQALRNLLDNALKFTDKAKPPRIEIGCSLENGQMLLWVKDNGIGFDIQYQERIYELFQRLHRIEDYPGTGIGLALVRKVAERQGGRTWAESLPGLGATFYIELPQP